MTQFDVVVLGLTRAGTMVADAVAAGDRKVAVVRLSPRDDDADRLSASLDGAAFSACVSPKTYSGLSDGGHSFHVRAVSRGTITVEAKPIYAGRTMTVWGIEITNEKGKLVCTSRCSILLKKGAAQLPES